MRPPKLGGNTRVGVFATRSPFRPNPIGLSSVQLTGVTLNPQDGPVIHIQGADLLDGTPIYDIKLALDPRPAYQQDPERIYGFPFAGLEIKFRVEEETLYVCEVIKEERK